jgi:hypothetical protein
VKHRSVLTSLLLCSSFTFAAQDVVSAVDGTVKKIDAATKIVVVETADGAKHSFHYAADLAVHGASDTAKGSKESLYGIKEGSVVAVHYTAEGGTETAHEIDRLGKDGLKATKVTISHFDIAAKTVAVKTADGTEETYRLSSHAAVDTAKDVAKATDKSAKVTIYYTEDAGKKTAHFIKAVLAA